MIEESSIAHAENFMRSGELAQKTKKLILAAGSAIEEGVNELYAMERYVGEMMPGEKAAARGWRRAIRRLKFIGYLKETKGGFFALTAKGQHIVQQSRKQAKKWDRKWRILIFDVPETRKRERDTLRAYLRTFGFAQLQESVWVYPYEVPKELDVYLRESRLLVHTRYIVATYIDHYADLLERFDLRKWQSTAVDR